MTGRKASSKSIKRDGRKENGQSSVSAKRMNKIRQNIYKETLRHVDHDIGMTNVMLNRMAKRLCPNLYRGLYTMYKLKSISFRPPFSIIVNVGQHFVTAYVTKEYILYFDSYGRKCCITEEMCDFLTKYNCPVYYNKSKLQSATSTHCGLYALLFAAYVDLARKPFELFFYTRAGKKNDELCKLYLQKIVDHVNMQ